MLLGIGASVSDFERLLGCLINRERTFGPTQLSHPVFYRCRPLGQIEESLYRKNFLYFHMAVF